MNILSRTIKQAYAILRAHKILWALGLFLFWNMGLSLFVFDPPAVQLGIYASWQWVGLGLVLVLLVILYFRARATIILSVNDLLDKKPMLLKQNFSRSKKYWPIFFLITLMSMGSLLVLTGIISAPVAYLWSHNLHMRASVLAALGGAIFLPLAIMLIVISNLAPLFIIVFRLNIRNSIRASVDMIRKNWPVLLMFSLWLELLTFFGAYVIFLCWRIGLVFLGQILYNNGGFQTNFTSIIFLSFLSVGFLFLASIFASYQQIAWTVMFREIVRPQKTDEQEALPVPEII